MDYIPEQVLPSIEEIYPHVVGVKHRGKAMDVALRIMRHLEGGGVMINKDFHLNVLDDPERILVSFRKAKPARKFKAQKKRVRDEAEA